MRRPQKPFDSYKWRWLSVQPTEGLLSAPVYLGVLRVLEKFEGEPFSSEELVEPLKRVQEETKTSVQLARPPKRNLFRNSGQYWKGTGLLSPARGKIQLTGLGRSVARGATSIDEFADTVIHHTVLPNKSTYGEDEVRKWQTAGIHIHPFLLILKTVRTLGSVYGKDNSFLTPNEMIRVIIPLAATEDNAGPIADAVYRYRTGRLDASNWPNCTPRSNDRRMAKEFLLFLQHYGVLSSAEGRSYDKKFLLEQPFWTDVDIEGQPHTMDQSHIPECMVRSRVLRSVLNRPNQSRFRREVLADFGGRCLVTGEGTRDVLEAAHIIPVDYRGSDTRNNGLCLRVDIHRLFDTGRLRMRSDGRLVLHQQLEESATYSRLPKRVVVPDVVRQENLDWRWKYL